MSFEDYVAIIDTMLQKHWGITDAQVVPNAFGNKHGTIAGTVKLLDGSYVDFFEEILITPPDLSKRRYSYQYVKDETEVFRYDNYPNHPGLRPPYHHKHVPKKRLALLKAAPKLIDILEEALRHMF